VPDHRPVAAAIVLVLASAGRAQARRLELLGTTSETTDGGWFLRLARAYYR
jgi:hypothetical protein